MAKRTGDDGGNDWRQLLAAAVVEFGTRKVVGPYALKIPRRAFRDLADDAKLAVMELPNGDRLLTYSTPRPPPKPKR